MSDLPGGHAPPHPSAHLHRADVSQQENETRQSQDQEDEHTLGEVSCHAAFFLSPMVTEQMTRRR